MLRLQAAIAANQPSVPNLPLFASVNSDLNTALAKIPAPPADVDAAYRTFMTLEILWERRGDSDILHACGEAGNDLTKLFEIVDRRDWQDLKAANVVIQLPRNSAPAGLEAFAPLEFSVTAGGVPVESSYLFRHNISCDWTFKFMPVERLLRKKPETVTLNPKTFGPSVMQYFPEAGTVEVSAVLSYRGDSHPVPTSTTLKIGGSREFGVLKGFERAELLSWSIATAIAIASGLSIYYLNATGWGAFKDYLTLFLWGAGVDQGKNFLQSAVAPAK